MTYTATMTEVRHQDSDANTNKFYRAYVLSDAEGEDYRVLFNWGRIGGKGQFKVQTCHGEAEAEAMAKGKLYDKTRKGYVESAERTLSVVPDDLLQEAGVNEAARTAAAARLSVDPFARVEADTDRLIRLVTGPADVQSEAIILKGNLDAQMSELRKRLLQAEGSLDLATDVLTMKLGVGA